MARRWVNLVGVAPLLLGIMVSVPQMVVAPLVVAQTSQSSQQTEAQRLFNEGERLYQQGNRESLQQALEKYQQALPLFRAAGDSSEERLRQRSQEAMTLNRIGWVSYSLGQFQLALNSHQQALPIWREVGDRFEEANTLRVMGDVYDKIGQPQQALNYYQQALTIYRTVRNSIEERLSQRSREASTLGAIGLVYRGMGQPQEALNYFQQALTIRRELGIRSREAFGLTGIGAVYRDIGQPEQALNYLQQALTISRQRKVSDSPEERLSLRYEEGNALDVIGGVYLRIGQPQEALNYFQQALTINRELGNRYAEAFDLMNIGGTYRRMGQPQEALTYYRQALSIFNEIGHRSEEAIALNNLALVHQALNDLPAALQSIQVAIAIVEDIRGQLTDPDSRTSYFATVQEYYKLQVELLMQLHQQNPSQGYNIQAFNVTERSKARTLLELLTESRADIRTGVDPQLLQQEQDIQTQLTTLDKRRIELASTRTDSNQEQITALETQRSTLQTQFQILQSQIRATSPKYAALKYPQPLTLEQIQQQILDDNTVILSYSLGEDRSYLWLISKTDMTSYELPAGKIIEDLINQKVRPQLTNPHTSRNSFINETSELSNILLKPVLEKTPTERSRSIDNKRIVIISDGALQYLPFGALPDPRAENNRYQPLLVNNEVVYLPSASTLQTLRNETQNRPPAPQTLAILADPVFAADDQRVSQRSTSAPNNELSLIAQNVDRAARDTRGDWNRLPGTRQEANTILNLVPENSRLAYFDFQANRENALSDQLSQYRFIHWATHGFANAQNPELSGIVMSLVQENGQTQDGYLLLGDIFNLNFNADLVVLSACQTGLGEVVQGEGLIGLTRGLMYAGTPRVVTSLWEVPDAETASLMSKFYGKMLQENLRPAAALRAAQLEMFRTSAPFGSAQGRTLSDRSWVAPYYWAAFTLQGEWN